MKYISTTVISSKQNAPARILSMANTKPLIAPMLFGTAKLSVLFSPFSPYRQSQSKGTR
ncbi:hypothetical protein [Moraxella sp. ZY200743]|uniref:hypothetical protein n=1 Tax=Moraxella sp. ZY200743 TaxID=2911970 RepID=UPI003D7DD26A